MAILLAAAPARANSADCVSWGAGKGIAIGATVPSGVYCFGVNSSGHQVYGTYGTYYTGWRYGNANWTTGVHGPVPSGRVCGSLRGNGKVLATICEPIP